MNRKAIKSQVSYAIHHIKDDGSIEWNGHFSPDGYSHYYKNSCRYNYHDACMHKSELIDKGFSHLIIVKEIKKYYA